jgi:uncharacterized protein (TIGR02996 family)
LSDTGRALFAEVCERVDDDAVKLVFADWLEEGGDEQRARAVRLAVERRALDDLDPRAWVLDARLERIDGHLPRAWRAELPRARGVFFGWHGGLPTRADVSATGLLRQHEEAIFAAGPITELELQNDPPGASADAAGCRYAHRVRKILFHGVQGLEADAVARLAACPGLAGLREFELHYEDEPDDAHRALVRSGPFPALRALTIEGPYFPARQVRDIGAAPLLGTVEELALVRCAVGTRELRALLQSPQLTGLRRLTVNEGLDTAGVRSLLDYGWRALEWLDLFGNDIGPVGGAALGESPHAGRLRLLDLGGGLSLGDRGLKALAESPRFGALRVLKLFQAGLTPAGLAALAEAPWLPGLAALELGGDDIGVKGLQALARAPLTGLRKLQVTCARFTDREARALVKCPWLGGLTYLNLDANNIADAGADVLAGAEGLGRLEYLALRDNMVRTRGRRRLSRRFGDRVQYKHTWER